MFILVAFCNCRKENFMVKFLINPPAVLSFLKEGNTQIDKQAIKTTNKRQSKIEKNVIFSSVSFLSVPEELIN